jgi:hypothetical protein
MPSHDHGAVGHRHLAAPGPLLDVPPIGWLAAAAVLGLNRRILPGWMPPYRQGPADQSWLRRRIHEAYNPICDRDEPQDCGCEDNELGQVIDHLPLLLSLDPAGVRQQRTKFRRNCCAGRNLNVAAAAPEFEGGAISVTGKRSRRDFLPPSRSIRTRVIVRINHGIKYSPVLIVRHADYMASWID